MSAGRSFARERLHRAAVALMAAGSLGGVAPAPAASTSSPSPQGLGYRAEAGFDLWIGDDAQQATASARWWARPSGRHTWSVGGRVGGARVDPEETDDSVTTAWIGGLAGYGFGDYHYRGGRLLPFATLAVDLPIDDGDRYELQTTVAAGIRLPIGRPDSDRYALHLQVFRSKFDGDGPPGDDVAYGVAIGLHQSRP